MPEPEVLLGQTIAGRYVLASYLGSGQFGHVYAADEHSLGDVVGQVAIKLLRPSDEASTDAVLREAAALAKLAHPHILGYRTSGTVEDGLAADAVYIAMELASETLADRMRGPRAMHREEVREVALNMASALTYLAERGLVHRDVKPANILRVEHAWKLGDFGLIRGLEGSRLERSGRKGTPAYMAPEALLGAVEPSVDVWALGAVVQECLTGDLPYSTATSEMEYISAILSTPPRLSPDLTEPFATIVRGCLVKDPRERWTAHRVLQELSSGPKPQTKPAHPPQTARAGDAWVNPNDDAEMVYVPAGEFIMGSDDGSSDTVPSRTVYLDGFWMYRCPVTVAQYRRFCSETRRGMPEAPPWGWKDDHPIVNVTWHDAKAYAEWAGVGLPTEAQWEKAARGTDGRRWPWGDTFDALRAACSVGDLRASTAPVGTIPAGASPYGCLDMAGNVREWCADWYDAGYYAKAPNWNPKGPAGGIRRVMRGGSWGGNFPNYLLGSYRVGGAPGHGARGGGFRCASGGM